MQELRSQALRSTAQGPARCRRRSHPIRARDRVAVCACLLARSSVAGARPPVAERSRAAGLEVDPTRLRQRQKQIDFGKNTRGYAAYIAHVAKCGLPGCHGPSAVFSRSSCAGWRRRAGREPVRAFVQPFSDCVRALASLASPAVRQGLGTV